MTEEWIDVYDHLPDIGEWVIVHVDHRTNPQSRFIKTMFKRPLQMVVPAQLRYVDQEGHSEWEQERLSSGHSLRTLENVVSWRPLPAIPFRKDPYDDV